MSEEQKDWIQLNLDYIAENWIPVETAEEADLRITTRQIALKFFEFDEVPQGTVEMLQGKLLELGFKRGIVEWEVDIQDPFHNTPEKCFAMCWFLKKKEVN